MTIRQGRGSILVSALSAAVIAAATGVAAQPIASVADAHATEAGPGATTTMTFTVTLSEPSPDVVHVGYAFADVWEYPSAGAGDLVWPDSGVLEFEPGQTVKTIPVTVVGDDLDEGEEAFLVSISDEGGASVDDSHAFGVIIDDDATRTLGCSSGRCTVRFPILSGGAGAGSAYVTVRYGDANPWGDDDDWSEEFRDSWWRIRFWEAYMITSTGRVGNRYYCEPEPGGGECGAYDDWYCAEWFYTDADGDRGRLQSVSLERFFEIGTYCEPDAAPCGFYMSAYDHLGKAQRPSGCWGDYDHLAYEYDLQERLGGFGYWEAGYGFAAGTFAAEPRVSIGDTRTVAERGYATFTITLDAASRGRTRVDYATQDGTAVTGLDYVALAGSVYFEPGELKKTVKVAIVKDLIREEDETFDLVVTDAMGAGVLRGTGTATIVDDEVFTIALPATVVGCLPATLKVTLPGAAPAGGVTVTLSSDNPNVVVPPPVFFKAGALSKTLKLATSPVAAREPATITATMPGEVASDTVTLKPMGPKAQPGLVPNPVIGGASVAGTVTLQCPAGPGDVVVGISSSVPSVAVPVTPTVVVPAGTQTWPFGVTTFPVDRQRLPTISVTASGISKGKTLTVNP
jgi:hypothetical protein